MTAELVPQQGRERTEIPLQRFPKPMPATATVTELCKGLSRALKGSQGHTGLGTYRDPETRPARPAQLAQ